MNTVKTYKDIARYSFLSLIIIPFFRAMIHSSEEWKVKGKRIIFTHEPITKRNFLHDAYSTNFTPMEYFYFKLSHATAYKYLKQAVMSAFGCNEAAYRDVRIFMHLTQCCPLLWHFDGLYPLKNTYKNVYIYTYVYV